VLAEGHFVPGHERGDCSRYKGKDVWPEVMLVQPESCIAYFERVHGDFNRKVEVEYTAKLKAEKLMFELMHLILALPLCGQVVSHICFHPVRKRPKWTSKPISV